MGISCSPFGLCAVDRGYWPPRQILGSHPSPLGDILRWQHVFSSSITTSDGPHSTQVRTQSSHSDNWLNRPRLTLLKCDHVLFRWSLICASRWNWSVFIGCFLVAVYTRIHTHTHNTHTHCLCRQPKHTRLYEALSVVLFQVLSVSIYHIIGLVHSFRASWSERRIGTLLEWAFV